MVPGVRQLRAALTPVWVCTAALAILGELDRVDSDLLGWWLSERQLPNGGLNGRPEKLEDVCYSWWNIAALSIIGKLHWINRDKLFSFILGAQVSYGKSLLTRRIWTTVGLQTDLVIGSMSSIPFLVSQG